MKPISILCASILWLLSWACYAQQQSLSFMTHLPQSNQLNPARKTEYSWVFSLPFSHELSLANKSISYEYLTQEKSTGKALLLSALSKPLSSNNMIHLQGSADIFGLYLQRDDERALNLQFSIRNHLDVLTVYSKDLAEFIKLGNGAPSLLGKEVDITPQFNFMQYTSLGVGVGFNITPQWRVGGRISYLIGNAHIENEDLQVYVRAESTPNSPITIGSRGYIRTSGIDNMRKSTAYGDADLVNYIFKGNSSGFSLDLASTFQLNSKITLEASLRGIGQLQWNRSPVRYQLGDSAKRSHTFTGITPSMLINEELNTNLEQVSDTLQQVLEANKVDQPLRPYQTILPLHLSLGARYEMKRNTTVAAQLNIYHFANKTIPSLTVGIDKQCGEYFGMGISYTASPMGYAQIGTSLSLGIPSLRIFFLSDNILSGLLMPSQAMGVNYRIGINFQGLLLSKKARLIELQPDLL